MGDRRARGWVVAAIIGVAGAVACGGSSSLVIDGGSPADAAAGDGTTADVTIHEDGSGGGDSTVHSDTGTDDAARDARADDDSGERRDAGPGDSGEGTDGADHGSDAGGDSSRDGGQGASDSGALDGNEGGADLDAQDSASDASGDVVRDTGEDTSDSGVLDANPCGPGAVGVPDYHRPSDSQCSQPAPPGDCQGMLGSCGADAGSPGSDSLCTAGDGGRCYGNPGGCECTYDTCADDTDCPPGELCACHGSPYAYGGNTCVIGGCRVDTDCGDGGYCSPSQATGMVTCSGGGCSGPCGGGLTGYFCHSPADECTNDCDCYRDTFTDGSTPFLVPICAWSSASSRWTCQGLFRCP